jgi:2-dehydro-3-deoxyphosphogluconate aldolase/(4S)-4-hydroxy-2-oxoglutarate aldolase
LKEIGLIAVIRGPSPDLTVKMVESLVAGGARHRDHLHHSQRPQVVQRLAEAFGDKIVLGMGTLTEPPGRRGQSCRASFLVSPVCDDVLGRAMITTHLPTMIGALTPAKSTRLIAGSDVVKVFPGSAVGPAYIKALRVPSYIEMMPTGGVSADNVGEWFAAGVFGVGAGSELCPTAWAKEGRFADITQRAVGFVQAVRMAQAKLKS